MCIIICKDAGVAAPSKKILQTCLSTHKDGFGAMWRDGSKVKIMKGLYTIDSITKIVDFIPKEVEAAFHFRMATHGTVSAGNCHPFPLSSRNDALTATRGVFDTGLMHNGIISSFGTRNESSLSDTMNFIKYLERSTKKKRTFSKMKDHFKGHYGKFIIFTPTQTCTFGDFVEEGGLKYSNTTYRNFFNRCAEVIKYKNKPLVQVADMNFVEYYQAGKVRYRGAFGKIIYYKRFPIFVGDGAFKYEIDMVKDDVDLMVLEGELEFSQPRLTS